MVQSPEPKTAARNAIDHWMRLSDLARFAEQSHGYGDSNGGFGITYPGDLDDFDRANGEYIPDGFLRVYGLWGSPAGYELLVSEVVYLGQLASVLLASGHTAEAERVWSLAEQRRGAPGAASDRPCG